jgi:hypothetical protein
MHRLGKLAAIVYACVGHNGQMADLSCVAYRDARFRPVRSNIDRHAIDADFYQ